MAGRKRIPQPAADGPQEGSGPLDEEVLLPDDVEGLYKPFDYKIAKLAWNVQFDAVASADLAADRPAKIPVRGAIP